MDEQREKERRGERERERSDQWLARSFPCRNAVDTPGTGRATFPSSYGVLIFLRAPPSIPLAPPNAPEAELKFLAGERDTAFFGRVIFHGFSNT